MRKIFMYFTLILFINCINAAEKKICEERKNYYEFEVQIKIPKTFAGYIKKSIEKEFKIKLEINEVLTVAKFELDSELNINKILQIFNQLLSSLEKETFEILALTTYEESYCYEIYQCSIRMLYTNKFYQIINDSIKHISKILYSNETSINIKFYHPIFCTFKCNKVYFVHISQYLLHWSYERFLESKLPEEINLSLLNVLGLEYYKIVF